MQKTLEILKNEDGLIVKKLSHKKLLIQYKCPIYLTTEDTEPFDWLHFNMRYLLDKEEDGSHFTLLYPKKKIIGLSQKFGIKVKHIRTSIGLGKVLDLDNPFQNDLGQVILDSFITEIIFNDPVWSRDYKIKKLLS